MTRLRKRTDESAHDHRATRLRRDVHGRHARATGGWGRCEPVRPISTPPCAGYEARLRSIVRGCRVLGVRPVLLTQPVLWSDHLSEHATSLLWHGWTHDGGFWPIKTLVEAMERFNNARSSRSAGIPERTASI